MYQLTNEQDAILQEIIRIADEKIAPAASEVDAEGRFPREAIDALAGAGLLGLTVPAEFGGKGQGMRVACAALETIGGRCASAGMIYLMHLCGCACYAARPDATGDLLRAAARGEHLTTLAWSEKGSRSHFWAPVGQAHQREGYLVLNAQKSWVTSAGEADGYVVSSRAPGATEPMDTMLYFLLREDPGLSVSGKWDAMGMRGNVSAPMAIRDVEIGADRALCDPGQGFSQMMQVLPWFSLGNAAISVGIAEAATQETTKHLTGSRLEHLGNALADLPILRARLAQMRIETDRARAHLVSALHAVENPSDATMRMVLEVKAAASESALEVTDLAMKACGGAAFSKHLGIERNFRDARAAGVMAPTSDVLYDLIGRALCGLPLF